MGVPSLPPPLLLPSPLKGGGGAPGETPPPVLREEEKGVKKPRQKAAFPGNTKEAKKCVASVYRGVANQRRAPGDDVRKKHHGTVM